MATESRHLAEAIAECIGVLEGLAAPEPYLSLRALVLTEQREPVDVSLRRVLSELEHAGGALAGHGPSFSFVAFIDSLEELLLLFSGGTLPEALSPAAATAARRGLSALGLPLFREQHEAPNPGPDS